MCQDKKRDTSDEHEKDKISSYIRIMNEKKMTMEMFLPYTN
jgi:hypothetical protein